MFLSELYRLVTYLPIFGASFIRINLFDKLFFYLFNVGTATQMTLLRKMSDLLNFFMTF